MQLKLLGGGAEGPEMGWSWPMSHFFSVAPSWSTLHGEASVIPPKVDTCPHLVPPQLPGSLRSPGSLSLSPPDWRPRAGWPSVPGPVYPQTQHSAWHPVGAQYILCGDVKSVGSSYWTHNLRPPASFAQSPSVPTRVGHLGARLVSCSVLLLDSHFLGAGPGVCHPCIRQSPWDIRDMQLSDEQAW